MHDSGNDTVYFVLLFFTRRVILAESESQTCMTQTTTQFTLFLDTEVESSQIAKSESESDTCMTQTMTQFILFLDHTSHLR
jgi:hypothetical protein